MIGQTILYYKVFTNERFFYEKSCFLMAEFWHLFIAEKSCDWSKYSGQMVLTNEMFHNNLLWHSFNHGGMKKMCCFIARINAAYLRRSGNKHCSRPTQ